MQPSPTAETSGPRVPSLRSCIVPVSLDASGATLAAMGDPPEPRPEQPIGDHPTPAATRRQYIKSGVLLAITGVSLYLLLPSLLSVLSSWPSLKHLDWPFAVLVLLFELTSWICL